MVRQTSVDMKERGAALRRTGVQTSGSSKSRTAEDAHTGAIPSEKGNWRSVSPVIQPKSALRSLYDKLQKRNALSGSRLRASGLEEDDSDEYDPTFAAGELVKGTVDTTDLWNALRNEFGDEILFYLPREVERGAPSRREIGLFF